jgi:hypothetical protein
MFQVPFCKHVSKGLEIFLGVIVPVWSMLPCVEDLADEDFSVAIESTCFDEIGATGSVSMIEGTILKILYFVMHR